MILGFRSIFEYVERASAWVPPITNNIIATTINNGFLNIISSNDYTIQMMIARIIDLMFPILAEKRAKSHAQIMATSCIPIIVGMRTESSNPSSFFP